MDFSELNAPARYVLRSGTHDDTPVPHRRLTSWRTTIWKTLNFFYGERCGFAVPGSHGVDHLDWFATHGDQTHRDERRLARRRATVAGRREHRRGDLRDVRARRALARTDDPALVRG
jgi:hypothetical protein